MNDVVTKAGYKPYNVSQSPTDESRGTRYFYGLKDLATPYCDDKVQSDDVIIMCDVDYYTDINKWLRYFRPILMYTFVPRTVVGRTTDYSYRFVNNKVEFQVAGGSSYSHSLWAYEGDHVSVVDEDGYLNVFNLEQREIPGDPDHRYVVFTPMARIPSPFYWFLPPVKSIQRLQVKNGDVNVLYEPIKDSLSIAPDQSWQSVNITGRLYMAIKQRLENKSAAPLMSDVERLLRAGGDADAATNAALVFNMMNLSLDRNVVLTNGVVSSYTPLGTLATEDGTPVEANLTPPVVSEPAVMPSRGVNSDEATIKGRINKVRNERIPPRIYKKYAREFVNHIVTKPNVGTPLSVDEVRQAQATTQQRARFKQVEATLTTTPANRLQAFIKAEAYAKITDPRNITTMAPELTIMLSSYTLAFKNACLKALKWYGPGRNPTQTVRSLADLCRPGWFSKSTSEWICIDYSRLDGTVSEFLQKHVMMAAYMRWVAPEYKAELRHCLMQVFKQTGVTANGVKFEPGYGTRSGSPQTTDGNTMICAYVVYCSLRNLGHSASAAAKGIGLVYGDDGAQPNIPGLAEQLKATSEKLGLSIKMSIVGEGEPLPYLGRYFVDPMTSKDSFQDPMRTLSKLHISANKSVTPAQALANKAHGYSVTDRMTPIIGTWSRKVIELTGLDPKGLLREEQHKMSNAWPQTDRESISRAMAQVLKIDQSELEALDEKVAKCTALDQLPVLFDTTLKVEIPAVYGHTVVEPTPHNIPKGDALDNKPGTAQGELRNMETNRTSQPAKAGQRSPPKAAAVSAQVPRQRNEPRSARPGIATATGETTGQGNSHRGGWRRPQQRGGRRVVNGKGVTTHTQG